MEEVFENTVKRAVQLRKGYVWVPERTVEKMRNQEETLLQCTKENERLQNELAELELMTKEDVKSPVAPRRRLTSADAPTIIQQGTGNQGTPATSTTNQIASRRRSPSGCSTAPVAPRRRLTPTSKMIRPRGRSVDGSQKGSL
ncbi:hypothetical protein L5515_016451 [Caenorhabditis briggsae]|uniref:Uncharacterized protein n=1 Tax=Caenorhabditis briggsae TaxID=6238 RepID=A0AAE9FGZ7_CAEBR|nr:hypothetical protein L5515_016451 [Caenorhabditis briggsae]